MAPALPDADGINGATTAARQLMLACGYPPIPCREKVPALPAWQRVDITNDEITSWPARFPGAVNTGIRTRDCPVIDIDVYDPAVAEEMRQAVYAAFGKLGPIRIGMPPKLAILFRTSKPFSKILTPSFVSPDGNDKNHVEILCDGQQLIAAGIHPETREPYRWIDFDITKSSRDELPVLSESMARSIAECCANIMRRHGWPEANPDRKPAPPIAPAMDAGAAFDEIYGGIGNPEKYAAGALRGIVAELSAMPGTNRNTTLYRKACRLGVMIGRGEIERGDVEGQLFAAMSLNGYIGEEGRAATWKTLQSGLGDGLGMAPTSPPARPPATPAPPVIVADEWDAGLDIGLPAPREWLLGNQFCRGFLSGLLAPGATGKTAVRTLQYLSAATGRNLTGQHVFKRCRVLQVSLEDNDDEMRRRLAAARLHHGIAPAELKGWLFCWTPKGVKLAEMRQGMRQAGQLEGLLRAKIKARNIDLLALDPFVKLHALEENDNGAMDYVCDLLVRLAAEFNIAVDVPHHTKKGSQLAGDADAGRGASSARDAGRLMYTLTRMSDDEGNKFNIPADDRRLYVRLDNSKVNLAPPSADASWFKLIGVALGNGNEDYPAGDNVQTVIRWQPPKTWEDISSAHANVILSEIDAGMPNGQRYSDQGGAVTRAAWPVVQKHCPTKTEPQCREIIRTWMKNGVLISEIYLDPIDRKERQGLRVNPAKRPE